MRVWADLFAHVEVCGPAGEGTLQGNQAPYGRSNVTWRRVEYAGRPGLSGKLRRLVQLPAMNVAVLRTIRRADFLLLRSPMHFSLVGAAWVRLLGRPSVTKWAGLFDSFAGERFMERMQRWLESRPARRNIVLVYGPATRPNVVSFLPALMSGDELRRGGELAASRVPPPPWRLLSVGRLYWDKGFGLALRGVAELRRRRPDLAFSYTIVGDGPERESLHTLASTLGLENCVVFAGALPFEQVQPHYAASHVTLMPGVMEGWPKVIAEAWAHGALPVAASAGLAPWILKDAGAGVLFEPTPEGLASALARVLDGHVAADPAKRLIERARGLSLESFRDRLVEVLRDRFRLQPRISELRVGRPWPLRVALVIDTLSRGGAERVLVTLANHLDPRRAEVFVVETRTEGPLGADLKPQVRHFVLGRRSRGDLVAIRRLADFLDRERIDVVHTHSHSSAYLMRLVRILSGQSWRHVVHDHHGPVESSWVNRTLDRLFLRRVNAYVAVSPRLLAYGLTAIGLPEEHCRFVPNGIEVPPAEAHHSGEGFTVVQVGRFSPDKDQFTALKVAARLRDVIPGLKWLMVGRTGGEAATYAEVCRDQSTKLGLDGIVTFTGEQADVGPFLSRADVAILTSRAEGLPISLLEAMAVSLPVVVTDVGACRALVEEGGGGIVAAVGDVEALAAAVVALSRDPARRNELGRRNREFVSRRFGAESMAEQVLAVYEGLFRGTLPPESQTAVA
ncbi:MAG TPA: glycosyltransferase [Thermoanaerobaculia bacterium]